MCPWLEIEKSADRLEEVWTGEITLSQGSTSKPSLSVRKNMFEQEKQRIFRALRRIEEKLENL